jgi:hypothetical protein
VPAPQLLIPHRFFKLPVNRYLAINIEGKIGQLTVIRTSSFINQIRAPGGHIQLTNMIDTQQQYIKLNIHGEVSIIVVQAHFFILSFCKALVFLWLEERIC